MEQNDKELWFEKYRAFCKETGYQLMVSPGFVPDKNDGTYKIGINIDVGEFKGE